MKHGFTLIELLVVVAIIAILSAIAVPNFVEAQTRAKVSRVKADLRTYNVGCEAYHIDWNSYPDALDWSGHWDYNAKVAMIPLSTPVAYLASAAFNDPFGSAGTVLGWTGNAANAYVWAYYKQSGAEPANPNLTFGDANYTKIPNLDAAAIYSMGPCPGLANTTNPQYALAYYLDNASPYSNPPGLPNPGRTANQFYDPTNGMLSSGGIIRYMGDTRGMPAFGY